MQNEWTERREEKVDLVAEAINERFRQLMRDAVRKEVIELVVRRLIAEELGQTTSVTERAESYPTFWSEYK